MEEVKKEAEADADLLLTEALPETLETMEEVLAPAEAELIVGGA